MRPYSSDIALALVASVLVIAGSDINKFIKRQLGNAHFVIKTLAFIIVCTFGYGFLTVILTNLLKQQLSALSTDSFALVVIFAFVALGIMAQRKNHI